MASEVPVIVGVVSPVTAVEPPEIVSAGAVVSTVKAWLTVVLFPAVSVTVADTVRTPSATVAAVTDQVPSEATTAVSVCPATVTDTVLPIASEVPEMVGVLSVVVSVAPPVTVNVGGTVSSVNVWVALFVPPARSRIDPVTGKTVPVTRAAVTDQVPEEVTIVDKVCPAIVTVTGEPVSAVEVPEIVGVLSRVVTVAPPSMVNVPDGRQELCTMVSFASTTAIEVVNT
jgi:hypothetical protein